MYRIIALTLLIQQLALVNASEYSTKVEYKVLSTVPAQYHDRLLPFKAIGRSFYYLPEINETELNWHQAVQKCRQLGGHLINLQNKNESLLIGTKLEKQKSYWTDLSNLGQTDYYSISTGLPATNRNWLGDDADEQLDEHKQYCVQLTHDYEEGFVMRRSRCQDQASYICQLLSARSISIVVW
ncbi:C-type lectin 37Db-like [Drosophila busckii]|uniref:C-type lectin 37Db-like n=1 Tax=Drosophila busckii TaxID=30019 RepID=UPI00083ED95B|nr:C-type lectin 37Db-like [Drosophila busckii]